MRHSHGFHSVVFLLGLLAAPLATIAQTGGTPWAWGDGDGNIPVPVLGLTGITALAGGDSHSLALENDGTVWAWGWNFYGQLGNGTNTDSNVPVQVSSLAGVMTIACGWAHSLALKGDGTVWAWGYNYFGQLGNGTNTDSDVPVQVLGLTSVTAIACGHYHSLALKSDGTLWAWGYNYYGQLGDGTNTSSDVPVQISAIPGVTAIAGGGDHSLALKNDGTLWAWGDNTAGELGNGTNTESGVPVQVSGLTNVTAIACGWGHSLALKNEGSVWAWGYNVSGQLGNRTNTDSNVPVQVSTLAGVMAIICGDSHSLALKTDGTLWSWGSNGNGQLGNGTNTDCNGPVQVSGLTNVTTLAGGRFHSLALGAACATVTFGSDTLPPGMAGAAYDQTITASGGTAPYAYTIAAGILPSGLALTSGGLLLGTPIVSGIFYFVVTATDVANCAGSQEYWLGINCPTITLAPTSFPIGVIGTAYNQMIMASGGMAPYTFTVLDGALPTGLNLNSGGLLTGTPTVLGTFNFTVMATDASACEGIQAYSVAINPRNCPTITLSPGNPLPAGMGGATYSQLFTASGGTGPYIFAVTSGTLSTGLSLAPGGLLSGTPTVLGTFNFTVTVTDANSCTGSQAFTVTINCPTIAITPASPLPAGAVGTAYSQTITASGGTTPYRFAITAGTLPPGLSFTSGGLFSGAPTAAGSFTFTVTATDANSCTASQAYSVTINPRTCPAISLSPASLPGAKVGTPYGQSITASGGMSPYTYVVSAGAPPMGLSLASNGLLSGTPTASGTFAFTAMATDALQCQGSQTFAINVQSQVAPPVIFGGAKTSAPFRMVLSGANFHPSARVLIGGVPAPATVYKSSAKVVAKGGAALKAMLPKGRSVQITVRNDDDGGISEPLFFTR